MPALSFLLVLLFRDACGLFICEIVAKPRDALGSDLGDNEPIARACQLDPPESRLLNPGPRVLETLFPSFERVEKQSKRPLVDRPRTRIGWRFDRGAISEAGKRSGTLAASVHFS